ncbi:gastrula zinc finger protein XlCGF28.1-like [Silurus asotus]|uniref:Gastrula zinc finger protein XlCGF28.1-like n=1 Tax=Silurus asotus TaxID=30991 RepID=A0AAD5B3G5_SILAS|nr:gastrula zinc finger protein XlCGF28.1-like [Silurus asotus]
MRSLRSHLFTEVNACLDKLGLEWDKLEGLPSEPMSSTESFKMMLPEGDVKSTPTSSEENIKSLTPTPPEENLSPTPQEEIIKSLTPNPFEEVIKSLTPIPPEEIIKSLTPTPSEEIIKSLTPTPFKELITNLTPTLSEEDFKSLTPNPLEEIIENLTQTPPEEIRKSLTPTLPEEIIKSLTPTPSKKIIKSLTPTPSKKIIKSLTPTPSEENIKSLTPTPSEENINSLTPTPSEERITSLNPAPSKENIKGLIPSLSEENIKSLNPTPSKEIIKSLTPTPSGEKIESLTSTPSEENMKSQTLTTSGGNMMISTNMSNCKQISFGCFVNLWRMRNNLDVQGQIHKDNLLMDLINEFIGLNPSFAISDRNGESKSTYRLISVINYIGRKANDGHFLTDCFTKNPPQWWTCNDEFITLTTEKEVQAEECSAFNTIIPQHLIKKLNLLGLNTSLCNWILDFLTGRPQSVRIRNSISSTTTLSTGASQGYVLSPLLFTLLTYDCAPTHSSNHIIKFADDTTVVGLIIKNDESAYRKEVQRLTAWCEANNLSLNVDKTKEMFVDFRRAQSDQSLLIIDGFSLEIVKSTKSRVHLADKLTWSLNTSSITKKAQQHLYFLRRLRKAHLPPPILTVFYRGTIKSILSSCITAWFGNCTVLDRKTLQRIVRTAEKIIEISLPSIMDISPTRCIRKAHSIVDDHTQPSHTYFTLLPSGKRFRSIRAITTRLGNSFFPQAIRLLNTQN